MMINFLKESAHRKLIDVTKKWEDQHPSGLNREAAALIFLIKIKK